MGRCIFAKSTVCPRLDPKSRRPVFSRNLAVIAWACVCMSCRVTITSKAHLAIPHHHRRTGNRWTLVDRRLLAGLMAVTWPTGIYLLQILLIEPCTNVQGMNGVTSHLKCQQRVLGVIDERACASAPGPPRLSCALNMLQSAMSCFVAIGLAAQFADGYIRQTLAERGTGKNRNPTKRSRYVPL